MTRNISRYGYHDIIALETMRPQCTPLILGGRRDLLERTLWAAHGQDPGRFEQAFYSVRNGSDDGSLRRVLGGVFSWLARAGRAAVDGGWMGKRRVRQAQAPSQDSARSAM